MGVIFSVCAWRSRVSGRPPCRIPLNQSPWRGAADRCHSHHQRAVQPGNPRAGDRKTGIRGGASRFAGTDQSSLSVQRADDHWVPDSISTAARARNIDATDGAASRRAAIGRRIHDARVDRTDGVRPSAIQWSRPTCPAAGRAGGFPIAMRRIVVPRTHGPDNLPARGGVYLESTHP